MYVYFIKALTKNPNESLVKIGKSNDPEKRLAELQTGSPSRLVLFAIMKCLSEEDAYKIEKLAHELFQNQHKRGEWFLLGSKREKMVKRLAGRIRHIYGNIEDREKHRPKIDMKAL